MCRRISEASSESGHPSSSFLRIRSRRRSRLLRRSRGCFLRISTLGSSRVITSHSRGGHSPSAQSGDVGVRPPTKMPSRRASHHLQLFWAPERSHWAPAPTVGQSRGPFASPEGAHPEFWRRSLAPCSDSSYASILDAGTSGSVSARWHGPGASPPPAWAKPAFRRGPRPLP